jgi:hypothetical protein
MGARKALFGVFAILSVFFVTAVLTYAAPDGDPTILPGQTLDTSTIRWMWNDNSSDEDGFEVRDISNNPIGSVGTDSAPPAQVRIAAPTGHVITRTSPAMTRSQPGLRSILTFQALALQVLT